MEDLVRKSTTEALKMKGDFNDETPEGVKLVRSKHQQKITFKKCLYVIKYISSNFCKCNKRKFKVASCAITAYDIVALAY